MGAIDHNIHDLNHDFLLAVRDCATRNVAEACTRFGVTPDFARAVMDVPLSNLRHAAMTGNLLFRCSLTTRDLGNLMRAPAEMRETLGVMLRAAELIGETD